MDLSDPHNMGKSRNTRFVTRVFTPDEQKVIFKSARPDTVLWALWAGKETAYKIAKKFDSAASGILRFYEATIMFEGCLDAAETAPDSAAIFGRVDTPRGQVLCRYSITRDYVHCIGSVDFSWILDFARWQVNRIPRSMISRNGESIYIRDVLRRRLSAFLKRRPEEIEIRREQKPNGLTPPFVYINGEKSPVDVSLSHDGRFAAYAFMTIGGGCPSRTGTQPDRQSP